MEGGTLHSATIYEDYVSLEVLKSEDNEYVIFKSVNWMIDRCERSEELWKIS